jgi:hypothetical protein
MSSVHSGGLAAAAMKLQSPPLFDSGPGRLVRCDDGGWTLNAGTTLPLNIYSPDDQAIQDIWQILHDGTMAGESTDSIARNIRWMVAGADLRCTQIEEFVATNQAAWDAEEEFVVGHVGDADALFEAQTLGVGETRSLLNSFGFESLYEYSRRSTVPKAVRKAVESDPEYARFDKAVADRDGLRKWVYRIVETTKLLVHTYGSAESATRDILQAQTGGMAVGWNILASANSCPCCIRASKGTYPKKCPPQVPVHVGCRCALTSVLKL